MATHFTDDLQIEAPPTKRARFEGATETTADKMESDRPAHGITEVEDSHVPRIEPKNQAEIENTMPSMKVIPGLGLLGQESNYKQISSLKGKPHDTARQPQRH